MSIFVEETGKTGFAHLIDLASPRELAQVNPGDAVELAPDGPRLQATSNGMPIGFVEPRVAARLLKLIADGNKYAAGVTSLGDKDVRIIIRETYQDPRNYGKVSFPTAAKVSDLRPYTKGTLVREEMELEEELEHRRGRRRDRGHRLRPAAEVTTDEAFEARRTTTSTRRSTRLVASGRTRTPSQSRASAKIRAPSSLARPPATASPKLGAADSSADRLRP